MPNDKKNHGKKGNKQNKESDAGIITYLPPNGTILENFHKYMEKNRGVRDVIRFLYKCDAKLLRYMKEKPPAHLQEEIVDFYLYFADNYDELTLSERYKYWGGQDALVLEMGRRLSDIRFRETQKDFIKNLPDPIKSEARSLRNVLYAIQKDRTIIISMPDGCLKFCMPSVIPEWDIKTARNRLLYICALMIVQSGNMVVRCDEKGSAEIFGIFADMDNVWHPLTKEELLEMRTYAPDGTRLAPDKGVTFTEIKRTSEGGSLRLIK